MAIREMNMQEIDAVSGGLLVDAITVGGGVGAFLGRARNQYNDWRSYGWRPWNGSGRRVQHWVWSWGDLFPYDGIVLLALEALHF